MSNIYIVYDIMVGLLGYSLTFKGRLYFRPFLVIQSVWVQIPNLIYHLGRAISCNEILGSFYIKVDLTLRCLCTTHLYYLGLLLIPVVVTILLICLALMKAIKQSDHNQIRTNLLYGMLTYEYKSQIRYFEIIKMFVRFMTITIINILDSSPFTRVSAMNMIMILYMLYIQIR
jgi:hypothetical protein